MLSFALAMTVTLKVQDIADDNQGSCDRTTCLITTILVPPQLVQKMVNDRAPNVQAVKDSGTQLLQGKDPKERQKIEGELKELDQRWEALNKKVADRASILEEVQALASQFTDILDPLTAWLEASDKQFAALEPQSADAEGIEKLIGELQVSVSVMCCHLRCFVRYLLHHLPHLYLQVL